MAEEQNDTEILEEVWADIASGFATYLSTTQARIASDALTDLQRAEIVMEETLRRKGDRFIFDRNMTRRQDNAKEGTDPIGEYAASYCAAWP